LKFSVIKAIGEIVFYLGVSMAGAGIIICLLIPQAIPFIGGILITLAAGGIALAISGYVIHKYGFFRENAEVITRGVRNEEPHPVPSPPSNICPTCHQPLTFIEQREAWYCFNCKEYQ
jgi:hypothetical protein